VGPLTHSRFGWPYDGFPGRRRNGHKAKPLALRLAGGFAILDAYVTPRPLLVAPKFHYVEVVLTANARRKIHRQFLAALPNLNVVGLSRNRKAYT
jgi:hypothetical protein